MRQTAQRGRLLSLNLFTFSSMTTQTNSLDRPKESFSTRGAWALLLAIFAAVILASLFTPPLLDDVDSSHAQAAQHMAESGDWVTLKVNGLRYLEKPPLPYWLDAALYRLFGENVFATHLPNALALLGCAWIAWVWASRAWSPRAGFYAALGVLTSVGPFLFTRFAIPEALLSFLFLVALYCLLTGFESSRSLRIYGCGRRWAGGARQGPDRAHLFCRGGHPVSAFERAMAALAPVQAVHGSAFVPGHRRALAHPCGPRQSRPGPSGGQPPHSWERTRLLVLLFPQRARLPLPGQAFPLRLQPAALWHLLAASHLIWLFPWSLFLPALVAAAWKTRRNWMRHMREDSSQMLETGPNRAVSEEAADSFLRHRFRSHTIWLLSLFSAFILVFFSFSTNQEYYTFPAWTPLIILIAGVLAGIEEHRDHLGRLNAGKPLLTTAWLTGAQAVFAVVGVLVAAALGWGLWESRHLPFVADVGTLLAHRGVGDYTLSMSHIFDLTGPSFAALRLPAALAAAALLVGPAVGWLLRLRGKHLSATVSVALTAAVFLIAAHIAFARFEPMLSSKQFADTIIERGSPADSFIIFGDQSDASSVNFYAHNFFHGKPALLVGEACSPHGKARRCYGAPATPTRQRSS
jgi:hypothetical protein